ncbi:uncharacterized protein TRIADDRAFT_58526 [Trichoplax adhaerens]|uniref:Transmembrane protein n=1 Tax=Trichoplax adhaerens TaxID=10228 RepID=B3S2Y1_TRIAD|nr:predicted protein [Trichoplax adhaerens]EDV22868.1 predicted protein [Trichoplax adhaerens]|eukprot:XP_002114734.1 predicted protein [Trichoplax adhaerens]
MAIDGGNLVYFLLLVSICNWSLVNADNDNSTGQPFHLILAIKSNDPIPTVGSKLTLIYNLTNKFINPTSTSNVTLYGSISGMQNRLPSSYSYAESPTDNYTTLASQTFYDGAVVEFLNAKFDIQFEADFTVDNNVKQRRYIYFTVSANYTDDDGNMKTISNTTSIRMAGITIQNPITYPTLNWPATLLNNLTEGETLKVVVPIQLPRGRNHIIFNIDAIGINPNNVPALSLTQFYAPPKPSVTYHLSSNVNKQSLTLTGLSNSLDYSTSTTSFFINMGDVEFSPNANSTMTTVDLEFLFLHTSPYNAIPVPRERCNLWFRPTYNNIDRATFDQSIILDLVRPILKVWKEAKAEETNLQASVNFKIIVSHKISSTALAYNVTIFDTLDTSVSPGFIPQIPTTYFSVIQRGRFLITNISIPVLNFGMNYTVSYRALIQSTPQSAPTNFTSDTKVEFNTLPSSIPIPYSSTTSNHNSASTSANTAKNRGCISLDYYTRTIYNNTQSILAGVFGVIGGIFIVVFMGFGYVYTDHKNYDNIIIRKKNRVSPTTSSFAHDNYHDTTSGGGVRNLMPTIFNRSPIRPQDSAKPVPTLYQMKRQASLVVCFKK